MNKSRTVTREELWVEFRKAIDFGDFTRFKTKRGMDGYINRLIRKYPGKMITCRFNTGHGLLECRLMLAEFSR